MLLHAALSSIRSTAFISAFVTTYMGVICLHRHLVTKDNKSIYFFAALPAGLSIFIQEKSKRSELALYVLPRALDSIYLSFQTRRLIPTIPHGEILLFALSMGALCCYRDFHPSAMSPLLLRLMNFFLPSRSQRTTKTSPNETTDSHSSSRDGKSSFSTTQKSFPSVPSMSIFPRAPEPIPSWIAGNSHVHDCENSSDEGSQSTAKITDSSSSTSNQRLGKDLTSPISKLPNNPGLSPILESQK
jgi:hypothetical protein